MKSSEELLQLAADLAEAQDYPGAIQLLEQAIEQDPLLSRAHNDMGVIYYLLGDLNVALGYLSKGVELEPDNALFIENLLAAARDAHNAAVADAVSDAVTQAPQVPQAPSFDPVRHIDLEQWLGSSSAAIYRHAQELNDQEWYSALCASVTGKRFRDLILPYFIDQVRQRNFVGSFGVSALSEAFTFIRILMQYLRNVGMSLNANTHILDFGCGWGRFTRFMLRYTHPDNIFGFDVDSDMIERCKKSFGCCNFMTVGSFPPSPIRDEFFDLIFAYSVFSHLSEAAANTWIEEFARITRPGGMVFLTTQGRTFIDFCQQIRESGKFEHDWHYNLAKSFVDVAQTKQDYDAGEFLYAATGGGESREASFYGEALIPKRYIERHWTRYFELIDFVDNRTVLPQALIVLRRRQASEDSGGLRL